MLAAVLTLGAGIGLTTSAHATSGTDAAVMDLYLQGNPESLAEGQPIQTNIQIDTTHVKDNWTDGYTLVYALPEGAPFVLPENLNYGGNETAINDITRDPDNPNQLIVSFNDPADWGDDEITEAMASIQLQVDVVESTQEYEWNWVEGGDPNRIVIVADGDEPVTSVDDYTNKSVGGYNIQIDIDHDEGEVSFDRAALAALEFTYTLNWHTNSVVDSPVITDTLPEGMAFEEVISATLTTWADEIEGIGLVNKSTEDLTLTGTQAGSDVSIPVGEDLPENSRLEITYTTKFTDAFLDGLQAELQAEYEALMDAGTEGETFGFNLKNTVEFGEDTGNTREATVGWQGSTPAVGIGHGEFNKTVDSSNKGIRVVDEDGNVDPAIDVEYQLTADLSQFTGFLALDEDTVIVDALPAGFVVDSVTAPEDAEEITAADEITPASLEGARAEVRALPVGSWVTTTIEEVDYILVNIGREGSWTIDITGQFVDASGYEPGTEWETGYEQYRINNKATLYYDTIHSDERHVDRNAEFNFRDPSNKDGESVKDPSVFTKDAADQRVSATPGEVATILFNFNINGNSDWQNDVVPLDEAKIVDKVDRSVFDTSPEALAKMAENVNPAGSVELVMNGDDLEITIAEDYLAANPDQTGIYLQVPFYTFPIQGKQTIEIENVAYLEGSDRGTEYISETSTSASSFARELQLRKSLWDAQEDEYSTVYALPADDAPEEFVYKIELIPHNGYGDVNIKNYQDLIPEVFDVLGFVGHEQPDGPVDETSMSQDLGRGITATWDDEKRALSINGRLASGSDYPISVAFKVKVKEGATLDPDTPTFNRIGGGVATIVPEGEGYPLLVFKKDALNPELLVEGGTFSISSDDADDFETITDATASEDGLLVNADGSLIRVPAGTYTIVETEAPAGYFLAENEADRTWTLIAREDVGFPGPLDIANDPKTYAIGDYTWIDLNSDGIQDEDEPILQGVKVELLDANGEPAVDVNNEPVAPVYTDDNGRYIFDNLAAGDYQVRFTLEGENAERFVFTEAEQGDDPANDSDANVEEGSDGTVGTSQVFSLGDDSALKDLDTYKEEDNANGEFVATEGIDPTWDAGVVWRMGEVQISKTFLGPDNEPIGDDDTAATFTWEATLPEFGNVADVTQEGEVIVTAAEALIIDQQFPVGTVVTITEGEAAAISGYDFDRVEISGSPATVAVGDSPVAISAVNHYTEAPEPELGSFSIVKNVEGLDELDGVWFHVTATWDTDSEDFILVPGVAQEGPQLPLGTVVEISEGEVPEVDGFEFVSNQITINGDAADEFTITGESTEVEVTNVYEEIPTPQGSFTLVKELNNVTGNVGDDATFVVTATTEEGSSNIELTPGVVSREFSELAGTEVTFTEQVTELHGHHFDSVIFTVDGKTLDDGTYVVEAGVEPVEITVTNTYNPVDVPESGYVHEKASDPISGTQVDVGDTITYTLTGTNTGETALTDVAIVDDLSDVLDKATYNGDVSVSIDGVDDVPAAVVDGAELTWTGDLAVGQGVVITYSVTVSEDAVGLQLENELNSSATPLIPENPADPEGPTEPGTPITPDPEVTIHPVTPAPDPDPLVPGYEHAKSADPESGTEVEVGDTITYTITGTNTGETDLVDVVLTDNLADVLDKATYNDDAAATSGDAPVVNDGVLTWSGDLGVGESVSVTYSVTVTADAVGQTLENSLTSTATPVDPENPSEPQDPITPPEANTEHPVPPAPEPGKVSVGDFVWVDSNGDGRQDPGEPGIPGVVLEIVGPDGEPVVDVNGDPVDPTTTGDEGEYIFENLPVLEDGESYTVRIVRDHPSTETALKPYVPTVPNVGDREGDSSTWEASSEGLTEDGDHDPTLDFGFVTKTYAIGDVVWVDTDKNGAQGEDEFLPDVTVVLYEKNADGEFVEVDRQVTDDAGRYLFDELAAGEYQVQFILTDDQAELYDFTTPLAEGVDPAENSDAGENGFSGVIVLNDDTPGLTTDYDREFNATQGVDPTWDAGVVLKDVVIPDPAKVTVGDLVWVDSNGDGRQDPGEPGIPGVVLEIVGPDGEPVVDVYGKPVDPTTTDENGKYIFENLPVLEDGQSYTVRIVRDHPSTQEALAPYTPTLAGQGDREGDSSNWSASSQGLTQDGDQDLTLDFGFVLTPEVVDPPEPPVDPEEPGKIPDTGANVLGLGALALLAMGAGAGFLAYRRRLMA